MIHSVQEQGNNHTQFVFINPHFEPCFHLQAFHTYITIFSYCNCIALKPFMRSFRYQWPGILIDLSLLKSHWSQTNVNGWSFPVTSALPSHQVLILLLLCTSLSIGEYSEKILLLCNTHVFNPSRTIG